MNRMQRRAGHGLALAIAIGLAGSAAVVPAVAGVPTAAGEAGTRPASQVEWGQCPSDVVVPPGLALTCATVPVPLNYSDPEGPKIELTISRLASQDASKRRGILLLNPGGPGGSGLTLPTLLATQGIPDRVLDTYDLIGMDTRGVGHSTPVSCGITVDSPYMANIPPYAVDDAAVVEQAKIARSVAEQCAANDKDGHLRQLTTANMARDLDQIRAALGEEKASFLGFSYGSALGAAYDSMFPERADRVVLDSNLGDTHLDRDGLRRFAHGMEETFPDFAKWAAKRHGSYGLGRTPAQVRATYLELAERLDEAPMAELTGNIFRLFTFGYLYNQGQYPDLAQVWESVLNDDEAAVRQQLSAAEQAAGTLTGTSAGKVAKTPAEMADPSPADNSLTVFLAVTCNDVAWSENVEDYRRAVAEDRVKYPLYGAASANITPCAFWPYEPAEPPAQITDEGKDNILIIQNLRDPVTPHLGGELLRDKFGDRSRLVSVDGSGHGVYALGTNACALEIGTKYLVDGELPRHDTFCRAS